MVKNNLHRIALTRLLVSAHKLHVETGRYNRTQIADRLCKLCVHMDIEDEYHVVNL